MIHQSITIKLKINVNKLGDIFIIKLQKKSVNRLAFIIMPKKVETK